MNNSDSLAQIESMIEQFAIAREWDKFHTPKNLILAAVAEMGELAELLQWKSDEEVFSYLTSKQGKQRMSEEIADVVIYLIRLCQKSEINLIEAINSKVQLNSTKYPIALSKGNSKKYTEH